MTAAALGAARARGAIAGAARAEREAARTMAALRDALEAADMGTWRRDLRTDRCTRDAGLNRLLGLEAAEVTAPFDDLLRRVHPADRARVAEEVARAVERRGECDVECRVVRPDGGLRWLRHRGRVLCDEDGAPAVMTGAIFDITERKRAEEALRASDERLRTAVWASGTGTYFWDLRSNRMHHDEGVRRLFAFSSPSEGGHIDDFALRVHDDDRGAWRSALERSARDGADLDIEYRVVWPDGSVHWLLDRAKMVRDDAGLPTYMSGACLEITEQKRAQQALHDADRRKDEFLAMLAHELRNPLAPIRAAVQLLRLRGQGAELERIRGVIERQAEHLTRLVDDLLEVSRITSGKIRLKREPVALDAVVARAVEASRPMLEARRHVLDVTAPDRPLRCEGDPIRLAQVLANLLNNAAKYTPEGGRVTLGLARDGVEAVITVRDTGPGIPPEMLEKVFELFTQVDRSLDRAQGGLGIGLTLARRLVELHGGSLRARAGSPPPGAELVVRLPLLADPPAPAAPAPADAPEGAGRRVLVVDDNVDAADTLAELLGVYGHAARAVHDGARALEAAREAPPEVVLLDIGLPGMNGYEVARRLRAEHPRVVLVALTGYGQDDDVRRCREAGFDHHRVKPVDVAALVALLADAPP
ncbi:MAG: PAS domain-containing protein [Planctomycetes bacterium]|nr:PAS domain-containing protein [Planctomycetota bacterium]